MKEQRTAVEAASLEASSALAVTFRPVVATRAEVSAWEDKVERVSPRAATPRSSEDLSVAMKVTHIVSASSLVRFLCPAMMSSATLNFVMEATGLSLMKTVPAVYSIQIATVRSNTVTD